MAGRLRGLCCLVLAALFDRLLWKQRERQPNHSEREGRWGANRAVVDRQDRTGDVGEREEREGGQQRKDDS